MRSATLKNWTVALAAGAAIVVVGATVASAPAFGEEAGAGNAAVPPVAPTDQVNASKDVVVTEPKGLPEPSESLAQKDGTAAENEENGDNVEVADAKVPDPFAPPANESDLPSDATAFDPDTVKTDFQSAPPALSPAALLLELRRSRAKQNKERMKLEQVKTELVNLRAALAEQSEAVEKRIAALATAQREADERIQAEAVAKLAAKDAAVESKRETKSPEAKAKKDAVRRLEVQRLAATTKGMEATEAARFLGALTTALAAEVVGEMKPKLAGAALAKMKPRAAAKIATRVVERR